MNEHQRLAIKALGQMRGDDLARARHAFGGMTPEEMCQPYGHSGKTRAGILAEYEAHDAKIDAAIEWVKASRG